MPQSPAINVQNPQSSFWDRPLQELLSELRAAPSGLTAEEAERRLSSYGPNTLVNASRFGTLVSLFRFFTNPLVVILLAASGISVALGERAGGLIIIAIVVLSVLLNFVMEFQAHRAAEEIRARVATTAAVIRDGKEQDLPQSELVPGDFIRLAAGDLVPADCRLTDSKDLHVRESALTGESLPVEKKAGDLGGRHSIADAANSVFLGTSVQTGIGTAVVVFTGRNTVFGKVAQRLVSRPPVTEFGRGVREFGLMITRVTMLLVVFVLLVNIRFHRPLLESLLFSVALAVGMTPELMPMIFTVALAQGAQRMTRRKVLVKQLAAIEDFGSIELLCTDKTGTLTEDEIVLERHVDIRGNEAEDVLRYIYLNSQFQSGIKSPLDNAILKHQAPTLPCVAKIDEIPFDFNRKRLSVVLECDSERLLIAKGEAESMVALCRTVMDGAAAVPFSDSLRAQAHATFQRFGSEGYRTLAVAIAKVERKQAYEVADECEMTLVGFAAFLDPPKKGISEVLDKLQKNGIRVVILTGDNQYVTRNIAAQVGLPIDRVITGVEMDSMDDAALAVQAENGAIFARVSPEEKNRVILALKGRGRVVGYLGDGINDAPSLHAADVGISVENGVDVAKDAAKIILLEKDLEVLNEGVMEGRRCFANIMKYIIMATSSNFGNMFSMAAASLFLPFLPMLPTQILLNNFLYDSSQIAIPADNVDEALLRRPKRWRIEFIRQFMTIVGPISSVYDFLTFGVLLWFFHAANNPLLFRTGWFVESLATQTLVVFVIRTAGNPFRSRPGRALFFSVLVVVAIAVALPYTPAARTLGFVPPPVALLGAITLLALTYLLLVQLVKSWFYRRHALL